MNIDVAVVGAGLCGTLAARALREAGRKVACFEAGPSVSRLPASLPAFRGAIAPALAVAPGPWRYRAPKGYDWFRVRAQGGRTLLWGGWLARPASEYFDARARDGAPWPMTHRQLARWVTQAERALNCHVVPRRHLHPSLRALPGVVPKREGMLAGGQRMMTAADLSVPRGVFDAPVLRLEAAGQGWRVVLAGHEPVLARRVVLAASPLESARIIEASLPVSARRRRLDYADHLIAGSIAICARDERGQRRAGHAEPSGMLFPARDARARFSIEVRGPTPLEALDAEDLATLGFTPETAKQHSFFVAFAMGETDAHVPRQVELLAEQDSLGRPMPRFVKRAHTPREKALADQLNARVMELGRSFASSPEQVFQIYDALDYGSGGHEVGFCLPRVDSRGEVSDLPGVFVADGGSVPGATDRHPSLTLAAHALRVASLA